MVYVFPTVSDLVDSEELKFAQANGYKIDVLKGYSFNKVDSVFVDYINDLYLIKSNKNNTDVTTRLMAKSLLNNLLGRFGMDYTKPITKICDISKLDKIALSKNIINHREISEGKYLVSFSTKDDFSVANDFGIDILNFLNKYKTMEPSVSHNNVSLPISAAVTAYGRIHISKIKLDILNNYKGNIYYSDTDSIVTNVKLKNEHVSPTQIGLLKLEHEISSAYFISGKTYCFINS